MNAFELWQAVRLELSEAVASYHNDFDLIQFLNLGFKEVQAQANCFEVERAFEVVQNQRTYPLLKYIPDWIKPRKVKFQDRPLGFFTDQDEAAAWTTAMRSTASQPWRFFHNTREFGLFPIPTVTRHTAVTVTPTQDSMSVPVAAGLPADLGVQPGWLLGIGATPTVWYPIATVANATITLQRPYDEATPAPAQACVLTSGAIRVWYKAIPPKIRILSTNFPHYTTGKVVLVNGSKTVTGALLGDAPAWGKEIVPGMMLGIGTAGVTDKTRPVRWYKVRAVDLTGAQSLTLYEPYELESATKNYVLTDPSPFTPHEEWDLAAVYWAAAAACRNRSGVPLIRSQQLLSMYGAKLQEVNGDVTSLENEQTDAAPRIRLVDSMSGRRGWPW